MKIIILSLVKIKEKDVLVTALSEEEVITFKAHGALSPNNKNAAINNILTILDAEITTNKTGTKSLKECSVISVPDFTSVDLNYMATINSIAEATNKMLDEEERHLAFPYLEKALYALKEAKYPLLVLIAYLAKLIKLSGGSFEINRCVACGRKQNIVAFSFIDGGYICKDCLDDNTDLSLSTYSLALIRTLCGTQDFNFNLVEYNEGEVLILLKKFIIYISDGIGVFIESPKLITSY